MPDVTEIRVHGVSGTPPEDLLQIQPLRQVDGDDTARFLRRSQARQEPPVREAFHWGSMTSGSVSKALWLLLAPFGVLNLARYTPQNHLCRYRFFGVADDIGAWALTVLAAGLAFLGVRAFRSPQWRRRSGILWDLLAFWPRLAHSIIPPPYGGRAVLALAQRVRDKAQAGSKVVLSGPARAA
jgi:hypothetical protein